MTGHPTNYSQQLFRHCVPINPVRIANGEVSWAEEGGATIGGLFRCATCFYAFLPFSARVDFLGVGRAASFFKKARHSGQRLFEIKAEACAESKGTGPRRRIACAALAALPAGCWRGLFSGIRRKMAPLPETRMTDFGVCGRLDSEFPEVARSRLSGGAGSAGSSDEVIGKLLIRGDYKEKIGRSVRNEGCETHKDPAAPGDP